jgi:predicted DNA-binding protein
MPRRSRDASQIVSLRLPHELLRRLDRYLDWRETARQGTGSRNAAIREALSTWLNEQELLAGLVAPETLRQQFHAAYTHVSPTADWVSIPRLRQQLQWPAERFDAVVEGLRAEHQVERERAEPGALRSAEGHASYAVHGHLYVRLRWCA